MEQKENLKGMGKTYGLTFSRDRSYLLAKNRIYKARKCPIYECLINSSWREDGLGNILLSRKQPDGNLIFGSYLVDTFCLGLKDTFYNAGLPLSEYNKKLKPGLYQYEDHINCPVSLAHQIIYGAIEYAAKLGFKPQKNFRMSKYVLEERSNIKEDTSSSVEFGKDGKPFYAEGPYDNTKLIIETLEKNLGKGNFNFLINITDQTSEAHASVSYKL
ncbi:MAG: hypothetical protein KAW47_08915 [Thermoplasmatales archaeon]|nr:hypothetical protein [Thermoplasmatales archaeon]